MMRRYAYLGVALGLALVLVGAVSVLTACYDLPQPACGFRCGALGECPTDYTCQDDGRCHLNGSAPMVCGTPDAGIDGDIDAPPDAPPDAPTDAPPDATPDVPPDAPTDAPPDAPPDV